MLASLAPTPMPPGSLLPAMAPPLRGIRGELCKCSFSWLNKGAERTSLSTVLQHPSIAGFHRNGLASASRREGI